jgi:cob(I)alamin adenosyltransferase
MRAMRLTKIYTKTGDKGGTMLASGERVSKAATRIEAYGNVDELNSYVGLLLDHLRREKAFDGHWLLQSLARVQNELFDLGSELATPAKALRLDRQKVLDQKDIAVLEGEIDTINDGLKPLANFVLPGGHTCNSLAHVARTVCRRAERDVVRLCQEETDVRSETQIYLNRLSDWFFVVSRGISQVLNVPEVLWQQRKPEKPAT